MRQKPLFAVNCLVCALICWKSFLAFEGTEFGGGLLAGNQVLSAFLFIVTAGLVFKYPRASSIVALIASYFSLPLYLYLIFPRPFRLVWPGNWAVLELPRETFVWNGWWAAGIVFTTLVAVWSVVELARSYRGRRNA